MAAQNIQNVCLFYKFGYCKHKDCCRKQHVKKVCDNNSCDISKCSFRHPKICKFYRDNGQCKFDPCMFKHVNSNSEIENMQIKLNIMEEKLNQVLEISNPVDKFNSLEKQIREKDIQIENLQKTIDVLETKITKFLENNDIEKNKKDNQNDNFNNDKIEAIERKVDILEKRRLGSDFCDFCDKEFKLGCEKDRKEKEIHVREAHTFECNICEIRHNNKEELDIHRLTCEIYVCSLCSYRHKRLSELKSHCKTKHTRNTIIKHCKMERNNFSKLSCTNYFSEEI